VPGGSEQQVAAQSAMSDVQTCESFATLLTRLIVVQSKFLHVGAQQAARQLLTVVCATERCFF
jgi:hypothetical protein